MLDILESPLSNESEVEASFDDPADLISHYLDDQRRLTAVEKFAQHHADAQKPLLADAYRDLIPLSAPRPGEQYAFEVDLDACTGCKACVTACHSLNGLDEDEAWRGVGQLVGGSPLPIVQHVTAACHHCVEPACMIGCPVKAYEKDRATGIVKHLDDQCIGCQYCTMACPYEVPQYSASRGIVRKCDMCQDRLAAGEAPACVQGCPNGAIRITTVSKTETVLSGAAAFALSDCPDPHLTLPTTRYKSARPIPAHVIAADHFQPRPAHGHPSLVGMLILTQWGVGLLAADLSLAAAGWTSAAASKIVAAASLVLGQAGLLVALTHLGRPHLAFRAILGLRTSWLSREIVAFGLHGVLMALYVVATFVEADSILRSRLGVLAAAAGILGVYASAMVYVFTGRPGWNPSITVPRFFLGAMLLGLSTATFVRLAADGATATPSLTQIVGLLAAAAWLKMISESAPFFRIDLRHSALLLRGPFRREFRQRALFGSFSGIVLISTLGAALGGMNGGSAAVLFGGLLLFLAPGELLERRLFFAAVGEPRMPGGVPA
jgi:Fe-S-cluster-containing dehydrogenase component/DMSO reductase anchor subunit